MSQSHYKTAVYGLSGDPITNGHRWVLECASKDYRKVYLVMATNKGKKYAFQPLDRMTMCQKLADEFENVEFVTLPENEFLVRKAAELGALALVRGIRNDIDEQYEESMRLFNKWLAPEIETIYVHLPKSFNELTLRYSHSPEYKNSVCKFISSSLIRGIVGLNGWQEIAEKLVPHYVMPFLESLSKREKYDK